MTSEPHDDPETEKVASEATAWFVRLKEPNATDADRWAFRRWLAGDPRRHEAFNEVKRLWSDLENFRSNTGRRRVVPRHSKACSRPFEPQLALCR